MGRVLRPPTGLFCAQGVKADARFLDGKPASGNPPDPGHPIRLQYAEDRLDFPSPVVPRTAAVTLTNRQRRHLKGLAHHLRPVVLLGQQGLRPSVLEEIRIALDAHELIKVRVSAEDREARDALITAIAEGCGAELIQRVGHMATLFRRNPDRPKIALPGGR